MFDDGCLESNQLIQAGAWPVLLSEKRIEPGVEAIALVKTVQQNIIPPTINQEQKDPECDLDYVPNEAREASLNIGLSNSFGLADTTPSLW